MQSAPMQARRLQTRDQYRAVLSADIIARTEHFAMHRLLLDFMQGAQGLAAASYFPDPASGPWLGAMLPKRWARRAVTRNLIKRLIYAAALPADLARANAAHLVRLRKAFDPADYPSASSAPLRAVVRAELAALYRRAEASNSP